VHSAVWIFACAGAVARHSSDAMAIWISQFVGREIRLLDYIEGVGQPLAYYAGELRRRGCRTDSFPELQRHHRFQNLKARGYDLRAVPVFRFESVVADPAKRYGVQIDEELVSALINDAPEEDALPLLAFTLQRLWRRYAAGGVISKDNYVSVGGLRQLIEDAAERALHCLVPDQDVPIPPSPPPQQRVELAAAIFVPGLAQLNEQGAFIRRAAPWSDFTGAQQQLLVSFDQWRLVVRKAAQTRNQRVEAFRLNRAATKWEVAERAGMVFPIHPHMLRHGCGNAAKSILWRLLTRNLEGESAMEVWETVAEVAVMLLIPGGVVFLLLLVLAD
jgi:hypothetical protein